MLMKSWVAQWRSWSTSCFSARNLGLILAAVMSGWSLHINPRDRIGFLCVLWIPLTSQRLVGLYVKWPL